MVNALAFNTKSGILSLEYLHLEGDALSYFLLIICTKSLFIFYSVTGMA